MILQLSPGAPAMLKAAATGILVLHIGAGCVGLASGYAALAFRKGERLHRLAGKVFLAAMLVTLAIGAAVSPFVGQPANLFGGSFSIYLLLSAWMTVKRPEGRVGRFELGALAAPVAAAPVLLAFGWMGQHDPRGMIDGVPFQAAYVAATLAAFAAALDLKVILRRGISGVARITRHLWRMCVALFVASGALFIGQPQVFPAPLRATGLLLVPALAPLVLMVFWLLFVRFAKAFRSPPTVIGFAAE